MNDSVFDLETYIASEFGRRIGAAEEEAFLTGDGSKKPEGIFTKVAATKGATTEITGSTVSFDNIMDVFNSLRSVYRSKVKSVPGLLEHAGPEIVFPDAEKFRVGIDRVLFAEHRTLCLVYAPELVAGNVPILFGDFSYYWIAERQGRSFKRLSELYAANGQIGFLASERIDGKLILPEAVKGLSVKAGA